MIRSRWRRLNPRTRRMLIVGGTVETLVKAAALIDLVRRPADQVRGSKPTWGAAIVLVNSLGLVPMSYFVYGRRGD